MGRGCLTVWGEDGNKVGLDGDRISAHYPDFLPFPASI
jgi:hypothetical protein